MNVIAGSKIKNTNSLYRMFIIAFAGMMAFAVLLSWRAQLFFTAAYEETPIPAHRSVKSAESHLEHYNASLKQEFDTINNERN